MKYQKAEDAIRSSDYNTAVELLGVLPKDFKDTEYVLAYARYCKSVEDQEDISSQYWITWDFPREKSMYTGDFAKEMQTAREVATRQYEVAEKQKEKETEKKRT